MRKYEINDTVYFIFLVAIFLGWEVLKHFDLHIKEQGNTLGLDQIEIPKGQEDLSHREALNLVTTLPEQVTPVQHADHSEPFIWEPMTCSYTHCDGFSTVPILVNLTDDEL